MRFSTRYSSQDEQKQSAHDLSINVSLRKRKNRRLALTAWGSYARPKGCLKGHGNREQKNTAHGSRHCARLVETEPRERRLLSAGSSRWESQKIRKSRCTRPARIFGSFTRINLSVSLQCTHVADEMSDRQVILNIS